MSRSTSAPAGSINTTPEAIGSAEASSRRRRAAWRIDVYDAKDSHRTQWGTVEPNGNVNLYDTRSKVQQRDEEIRRSSAPRGGSNFG